MAESEPTPILQDEPDASASRRAAKRDSLFLQTTIADETGKPLGKARVRNLSEKGLMADCESAFRAGDRLRVELRGVGEVSGRVSWVRDNRIGFVFDRPIDPQAARKPVHVGPADDLPPYLRQLSRAGKFNL